MVCKRCGSSEVKKNGLRRKKQCYLCRDCHHQFTNEKGYEQEKKTAVLLYCLGLSFTSIAQVLFVHPTTVMRWVRKYAKENCKKAVPQGEIVIELDEMWHFARSKKTRYGFGKITVVQQENS